MSSSSDRVSPFSPRTLENCFSCRLLCGGGLIGASTYVYMNARKRVVGNMTSMGTVAQIMFAMGLAAFGITILARPQGSPPPK